MGGVFTISFDFELYWGVRDQWALNDYRRHLLGVRQLLPAILKLFEKYEIHATWATVGFLFFDSREELLAHLPQRQPTYTDTKLSPYSYLPQIGVNETEDLFHYAPSLIRQIIATPHQELATHTFSHYYCMEEGQTVEQFHDDLQMALRIAEEKYQRRLVSIIFPRNQTRDAYLQVSRELGLRAYRGNENTWLYRARNVRDSTRWVRGLRWVDSFFDLSGANAYSMPQMKGPLLNIPSSHFLRSYSWRWPFLEGLRLQRIVSALEYAARTGQVYHLWGHPHNSGAFVPQNLKVFEKVLIAFAKLREKYGMQSLTMAEIAERAV